MVTTVRQLQLGLGRTDAPAAPARRARAVEADPCAGCPKLENETYCAALLSRSTEIAQAAAAFITQRTTTCGARRKRG